MVLSASCNWPKTPLAPKRASKIPMLVAATPLFGWRRFLGDARVAEDLNVRIAKGREITFGLVFFAPQRGMERAENDIKRTQSRGVHISFAQGIEIHFDGMQNGQFADACAQLTIDSFNLN